jgi:hypothetical protein
MFGKGMSWIIGLGLLAALLIGTSGCAQINASPTERATLRGSIVIVPEKSSLDKILPGTPIKLKLVIENIGTHANASGQAYLRFAFNQPLQNRSDSIVFQTEALNVPAIEPGSKVELNFSTAHQWPSLLDFVRYDWLMREYQAVFAVDKQENVIATLSVTFSAYYYPGLQREVAIEVPSLEAVN